ncbi:MAG: CPBP family intramembrane metalloprotease [Pirellulales bacterium]|nr:CPBP family intramembrane metalloprotease [Pirellulales bacterium]
MTDLTPKIELPQPRASYWSESRRPLVSLVFISPLLVVYEAGVLLLGSSMDRNGVDVWLRTLLEWIGLGHYFLLPALTIGILLAWHHTTHQPWRVDCRVLGRMAVECVLLAVVLWVILQLQGALFAVGAAVEPPPMSLAQTLGNLVMFLGAGIYEELLFRLILLSAAMWALRRAGMSPGLAVVAAALGTSLLFSTAHYVGPYRDQLTLFGFLFRFVAGVFFCGLFVGRGFGIAAGAHAGYDILVGLLP